MSWDSFIEVKHARKVHKCVWCRDPIVVGETHDKFVGMYEGDFQSWRIHLDCVPPMEKSQAANDDSAICDGPHIRGTNCEC